MASTQDRFDEVMTQADPEYIPQPSFIPIIEKAPTQEAVEHATEYAKQLHPLEALMQQGADEEHDNKHYFWGEDDAAREGLETYSTFRDRVNAAVKGGFVMLGAALVFACGIWVIDFAMSQLSTVLNH